MANAHELLIPWTRQNSAILMTCSEFQQAPATKKSSEVIKDLYSRLENWWHVLQKKFLYLINSISKFPFQVHPDKLDESLTEEDRDKAYETFLAIDKAWKLLKNQETRVNLDKQLKGNIPLHNFFFSFFCIYREFWQVIVDSYFLQKRIITKSVQWLSLYLIVQKKKNYHTFLTTKIRHAGHQGTECLALFLWNYFWTLKERGKDIMVF